MMSLLEDHVSATRHQDVERGWSRASSGIAPERGSGVAVFRITGMVLEFSSPNKSCERTPGERSGRDSARMIRRLSTRRWAI